MSECPPPVDPWEDFVLRLIAIYKLTKTLVFTALGIGMMQLLHHNIQEMLRIYILDPMHFEPDSRFVRWALEAAEKLTDHKIRLLGYGFFIAAAFFAVEGTGLYLRKHWAEYMVLISTGSLLPIEIIEVWSHVQWWKVAVLVGNIAILLYLIHRLWLDSENIARRREERQMKSKKPSERGGGSGDPRQILTDPRL